MEQLSFNCPKCRNTQCDIGEIRTAGGLLSSLFDVETKRLTTVTCTRCKYTELYRAESSALAQIFDLFTT